MLTNEDIDREVLRKANELLEHLKSKRAIGKIPTSDSILTIKVANITYRLVADESVLVRFIEAYRKKNSTPRVRKALCTASGEVVSIRINPKSLPKFKKSDFTNWELCELEKGWTNDPEQLC